jgi:hypothetical protein
VTDLDYFADPWFSRSFIPKHPYDDIDSQGDLLADDVNGDGFLRAAEE